MKYQKELLGFFAGATLFLAFLYLYPPQSAQPAGHTENVIAQQERPHVSEVPFTVLDEGTYAPGAKNRKNYAVYEQGDLADFWEIAGHDRADTPTIDFRNKYVIVVFAGTKSSGGYSIEVRKVTDVESTRNVEVALLSPGEGCVNSQALTSPYQFIVVPFGEESSLSHTDIPEVKNCN